MRHVSCLSLVLILAGHVLGAESDVIRADALPPESHAKANAVANDDKGIQFFGHQTADSAPLAESSHELRRPEPPAGAAPVASTAESRVLDHHVAGTGTWKLADLLPLAAVLAVIAVVGLIIRRVMPAKGTAGHAAGLLEVVARTPISPKQNVMLVRVAKRFLLLGVSPESVNTLCILDDSQSSADLMTELASRRPDSSSQVFENSFDAETDEFEDSEDVPEGAVRGLLAKVRRLKLTRVA